MKQKRFLIFALIMLLAGIGFMFWDMFFRSPLEPVNPYSYDLNSLKAGDTALVQYAEVKQITPAPGAVHGIATDRSGRILVCGEGGMEIYGPGGELVHSFSFAGMAGCIQADSAGNIYLGMQDHLEIFSREGKLLQKWGSPGAGAVITSVAVTGKDVFLADAGNRVVYRYDHSGTLLNRIGVKDPQRNIPGFVIPSPFFDLGISPVGELWVVNPGRHSFEKYSPEGDLLASWEKASMSMEGFCGCCNPSHFAFLADGSFVTSEKGIERIKIYSASGEFICVVADPSSFTEGTKGLDLAVDPKGRILVLDPERKKVRIFEMKR